MIVQPSIQKLVSTVHHDILLHCTGEEILRNQATLKGDSRLHVALESLKGALPDGQKVVPHLHDLSAIASGRNEQKEKAYENLVSINVDHTLKYFGNVIQIIRIIEIADRPTTHVSVPSFSLSSRRFYE